MQQVSAQGDEASEHANPETTHRSATSSLNAGLGFRLGRVHRLVRDGWERRLTDLGLTPAQAAVLRAIRDSPGGGLRELARRVQTDAMNARRLVERLEERELVASTSDPAHRQRRVLHPTPSGIALADQVATRSTSWNDHVIEVLGAEEYARLQHQLVRLETLLAGEDPS